MKHIKAKWGIATAACLLAAMLLHFAQIGYLGGDVFTRLRPADYHARPGGTVAVLWSGDMGFHIGMGPRVAARLTGDGIPVVGVNSLTYFRTTRRPSEATALLEAAIREARMINPQARILLIGQSFGADMLHVALAHLPAPERQGIALVALVVPGATVQYRASPSEIFTFAAAASDALPTGRQLTWTRVLCVYGQKESSSLCPLLRQSNAQAVALPGGHNLNRDLPALYGLIRAAMQRARLRIGG